MMEKLLVKKPEPTLGKTNKPVQNKPDVKKKNVRITDHNILMTILLNDPDALTTEEFLFLQSVIGYRQATIARQEGKKRKQQRKLQGMSPPLLEKPKLESKPAAPGSGLPDNLRAGLEKLSGVELSDVKVHQNSHKPQQVGALAYTKGNDIHIAPGQERYLPHEGWHAVQQKQGIVSAEFQLKSGLAVNADEHLEKEADIMGKKAESNSEDSILQSEQTNGVKAPGTKGTVIQRVTTQEEGRALHNTKKQETAEKAEIIPAAYGETSENVKKIQQVLMSMNYWTGRSGDKASEYFGDVTRESLINFQTGYMKLDKQELYDKKGKYVGCGPSTAKSLNTAYKLLNNSYVPEQAKNGIMGMGKSPENNSAYNWDIKAGVYNAYVKEAQVMLMNMGYRLPKYGADGKWSNSGETYEALLGFQKSCKSAFEGVKKNGNAGNLKPVEHFQGIEPTGSLDQRTYAALQKEKTKKVNVNYNNTAPKKVENGKKGTGKDNSLVDSFTSGFKGFFTNQYEYYKGKIQKAYTDPLEAAKENFKEAIIPPTYKIQMGIVNNIKENAELVLSGDLNKIVEHGGEGIAEMVETGALALISGGVAKIAGKVTVAKIPEGTLNSGTLSNVEARTWYLQQESKIPGMINKNFTLEQQAQQAVSLRNQFRTQARDLMADRDLAASLNKTDPNMTWEQTVKKYSDKGLQGDALYNEIINAAQRSRTSVNESLGIK